MCSDKNALTGQKNEINSNNNHLQFEELVIIQLARKMF
jgi:hypothetical protein